MTGLYSIRAARPEDAAAMADIDADVNFSPRTVEQFEAACKPSHANREAALVALRDGRLLGYVLFAQVLDEASIYSIAVARQCQRQGLGRMLLDAALERMRLANASRCFLEVRQSNAAARALYEGRGFALDGIRKNYYPAPTGREDALLMSKEFPRIEV